MVRGEDKTQNTFSVWKKRNVEISALHQIFASLFIDIHVDDTAFFLSIKPNANKILNYVRSI